MKAFDEVKKKRKTHNFYFIFHGTLICFGVCLMRVIDVMYWSVNYVQKQIFGIRVEVLNGMICDFVNFSWFLL